MSTELTKFPSAYTKAFINPTRDSLKELDKVMKLMEPTHKKEQPLYHYFVDNAYLRSIHLQKGSVVSSRVHYTQHFSIILEGDVTVATPDGRVERIQGPRIMITEPNTKRMITVHEDTHWITFHVTDKKNVDEIVNEVSGEDYI